MGADILLAVCQVPNKIDAQTIARIKERIDALSDERLNDVMVHMAYEEMEDEDEDWQKWMRERLHQAVDSVLDGFSDDSDNGPTRELTALEFGGEDGLRFIVTGGMSMGDSPTEVFDDVLMLDVADVCMESADAVVTAWANGLKKAMERGGYGIRYDVKEMRYEVVNSEEKKLADL
jgi:hypothetical protein